jgi:hypothetical protein
VLLLAGLAILTLAAGVDEAADADPVPDRITRHTRADLGDDTGDLMTRDEREDGIAPLAARGVNVGMTDSGVLDVNRDVVLTNRPARNRSPFSDVARGSLSWAGERVVPADPGGPSGHRLGARY